MEEELKLLGLNDADIKVYLTLLFYRLTNSQSHFQGGIGTLPVFPGGALLVAAENRKVPPDNPLTTFFAALMLRQAKMHDLPLPTQIP